MWEAGRVEGANRGKHGIASMHEEKPCSVQLLPLLAHIDVTVLYIYPVAMPHTKSTNAVHA